MAQFHSNINIDPTVTDPPGTCELLTGGEPCHAALCERAMLYHIEHIHGIHKPVDHFLYGFDTSSDVPSAVFVPNSHRYEAKKTSDLDIENIIVISQKVKKSGKNLYPKLSNPTDMKVVINEPDNITPKHQKPAKRKRIIRLKSSSDSSQDTSSKQSRKETPPTKVGRFDTSDVSNSKHQLEDIDSNVLETSPPGLSSDYYSHDFDDDDFFQALTQPIVYQDNIEIESENIDEQRTEALKDIESGKSDNESKLPEKDLLSTQSSGGSSSSSSDSSENSSVSSQSNDEDINNVSNISIQQFEDFNDNLAKTYVSDEDISQNNEIDDDTDMEEGDGDLYTELRHRNRDIRYKIRNLTTIPLYEMEENRIFIEDFKTYLQKFSATPASRKTPTIDKACSHLYLQTDSLLSYEFEKNPEFNLENLRNFSSNTFVHLRYPGDWISDTAGTIGNKGLDRLKAHCEIREFLKYEADKFDSSHNFFAMKQEVKENLEGINQQISSAKLFKKYNIFANNLQQKRKNAKMILDASKCVNVDQIVKTWNTSFEKNEIDQDYEFMYQNCISSESISVKMLTKYSQYARIVLLMRYISSTFYS